MLPHSADFWLILLFALTLGHLITLKFCSVSLDHRTAPLFIPLWVLVGLAVTYPQFGHLLADGLPHIRETPLLLAGMLIKSLLLYALLVESQKLMQVSLSSRHFVTPLSVGLLAFANSFLGERLTPQELFAAVGLCCLAVLFLLKGHLADLSAQGRITYAKLVSLSVLLGALDHTVIKGSNWYTLLLVSNISLLAVGLFLNRRHSHVIKAALFSPTAILAGVFYAATELVKFYQQVTINPVTTVATVQAMTKPVILVLSAMLWKERTVKEQLVWGLLAFCITLPIFFK